jgi:plasmid stabilization system protein ParE
VKPKIIYLPVAVKDLHQIIDYIASDKLSAVQKFLQNIDQTLKKLSSFPNLGLIPKDAYLKSKGYKILIIDNYLIFYLIKKDIIEIQRILHGKRKYQFLLLKI